MIICRRWQGGCTFSKEGILISASTVPVGVLRVVKSSRTTMSRLLRYCLRRSQELYFCVRSVLSVKKSLHDVNISLFVNLKQIKTSWSLSFRALSDPLCVWQWRHILATVIILSVLIQVATKRSCTRPGRRKLFSYAVFHYQFFSATGGLPRK